MSSESRDFRCWPDPDLPRCLLLRRCWGHRRHQATGSPAPVIFGGKQDSRPSQGIRLSDRRPALAHLGFVFATRVRAGDVVVGSGMTGVAMVGAGTGGATTNAPFGSSGGFKTSGNTSPSSHVSAVKTSIIAVKRRIVAPLQKRWYSLYHAVSVPATRTVKQ